MRNLLFVSVAASMALSPLCADALTTTSSSAPIKVVSCIVAQGATGGLAGTAGNSTRTNGVTMTFTNTSDKVISDATIAGNYNGFKITDSAKGTYQPGKTYKVSKSYASLPYTGPDATCKPVKVDFADGTTWAAPSK